MIKRRIGKDFFVKITVDSSYDLSKFNNVVLKAYSVDNQYVVTSQTYSISGNEMQFQVSSIENKYIGLFNGCLEYDIISSNSETGYIHFVADFKNIYEIVRYSWQENDENTIQAKIELLGTDGKTPVLKVGTVASGTTPSAEIVDSATTDGKGNPVYNLNLVLPKGDAGKTPVLGTVTTNTGTAGSTATAKFTLNGTDADGNPKYDLVLTIPQGVKGNIGFTPILQIGTVTSGDTAGADIAQNGTDTNGNPVYKINLTIPKGKTGDTGKTPQIIIGTVTTLAAGSSASATLTTNGVDASGNPKYLLNLSIPQGEKGSLDSEDAKDLPVTFTESTTRETITSGSTMATIFGKIKKWFTDLKSVAFSGSYTDLSDKPTKVSDFTNDSSFQTNENVNSLISTHNSSTSAHNDIRTSLASIPTTYITKVSGLTAQTSGFYKIAVNADGLVTAATAVKKADITGLGIPAQDTTYPVATISANGLMSSTDKTKLDGISSGANNYIHPAYTAKSSGLWKITVDATGHVSAAVAITKEDITNLGIPAQDTTYSIATAFANGLMSSTDKTLFDFYTGSNSVTTLASLPVTKNLVIATLSAATTISLASDLSVNQPIHICATATAAFTQAIPNTGSFFSMSGSSINIAAGQAFEIDILRVTTAMYSIMVSVQS